MNIPVRKESRNWGKSTREEKPEAGEDAMRQQLFIALALFLFLASLSQGEVAPLPKGKSAFHLPQGARRPPTIPRKQGIKGKPASPSPQQKALVLLAQGIQLTRKNQWTQALKAFRQAVQLDPSLAEAYRNLGISLVKLKRLTEAEEAFRQYLRLRPGDIEGYIQLALTQYNAGHSGGARDTLHYLLKKHPQHLPARLLLISWEIKDKDWASAEEEIKQGLAHTPNSIPLLSQLAGVYAQQKKEKEFRQVLEKMAELKAPIPGVYFQLGYFAHTDKKYDLAERYYRRAVQLNPRFAEAWDNLARVLQAQKKWKEASEAGRRYLQLAPPSQKAQAHHILGVSLFNLGKIKEAEEELRKAYTLAPQDPQIALNLGVTYLRLNQLKSAEPIFQQLLKSPHPPESVYSSLAYIYQQTQQMDKAIQMYQEALSKNPKDLNLREGLARAYWQANRLKEAIQEYQNLLKEKPKSDEYHQMLAFLYDLNHQPEEAEKAYREWAQQTPSAYRDFVNYLRNRNKREEAMKAIEEWKKAVPTSAEPYLTLGSFLRADKKYAEAREAYEKAKSLDPKSPAPYLGIAEAYQEENKIAEAIQELAKGIATLPDQINLRTRLASLYEQEKQYSSAREQYQKAIPFAKSKEERLYLAGNIPRLFALENRYGEAVQEYRKLLAQNPQNPALRRQLAGVLQKQGKLEEAFQEIRQILRDHPGHPETYSALSDAVNWAQVHKEYDKVIALLLEGVQKNPEDRGLLYHLTNALVSREQNRAQPSTGSPLVKDEGLALYKRLLSQHPKSEALWWELSTYAYRRNLPEERLKALQELVKLKPDNPAYHQSLAIAYTNLGKHQEALEEYRKVAQLRPKSAYYRVELARAYERLGKKEEAIREYQTALQIDPENITAKSALAKLKGDSQPQQKDKTQ